MLMFWRFSKGAEWKAPQFVFSPLGEPVSAEGVVWLSARKDLSARCCAVLSRFLSCLASFKCFLDVFVLLFFSLSPMLKSSDDSQFVFQSKRGVPDIDM